MTRETLLPTLTLRFQPWGKLECVAFQEALQSLQATSLPLPCPLEHSGHSGSFVGQNSLPCSPNYFLFSITFSVFPQPLSESAMAMITASPRPPISVRPMETGSGPPSPPSQHPATIYATWLPLTEEVEGCLSRVSNQEFLSPGQITRTSTWRKPLTPFCQALGLTSSPGYVRSHG